ncbi:hypothetical protein DdX_15930 [Ditylenchus destructor]|uniref:Uncharacterized protein n=1 Tax=Ditylenchus destructor TaxID=166010 RepID=A0AAD4MPE3_9BILA|nr:hypothetical protein DdX_15930 [Ditylenchus destructor]
MSHNSQDALSEMTSQFVHVRSCINEVLTSLSNTYNFLQCINDRIQEIEEGMNQYATQAHQTITFTTQENHICQEPNQFPFISHSELAVQEPWSATNPFVHQQTAPIYNENAFHPYQETTSEDDEESCISTDSSIFDEYMSAPSQNQYDIPQPEIPVAWITNPPEPQNDDYIWETLMFEEKEFTANELRYGTPKLLDKLRVFQQSVDRDMRKVNINVTRLDGEVVKLQNTVPQLQKGVQEVTKRFDLLKAFEQVVKEENADNTDEEGGDDVIVENQFSARNSDMHSLTDNGDDEQNEVEKGNEANEEEVLVFDPFSSAINSNKTTDNVEDVTVEDLSGTQVILKDLQNEMKIYAGEDPAKVWKPEPVTFWKKGSHREYLKAKWHNKWKPAIKKYGHKTFGRMWGTFTQTFFKIFHIIFVWIEQLEEYRKHLNRMDRRNEKVDKALKEQNVKIDKLRFKQVIVYVTMKAFRNTLLVVKSVALTGLLFVIKWYANPDFYVSSAFMVIDILLMFIRPSIRNNASAKICSYFSYNENHLKQYTNFVVKAYDHLYPKRPKEEGQMFEMDEDEAQTHIVQTSDNVDRSEKIPTHRYTVTPLI